MATSLTFGSALRALAAAPVPRPPQPMRPMRRILSPSAWTPEASDKTAAAPAEVCRNRRRPTFVFGGVVFLPAIVSPGANDKGTPDWFSLTYRAGRAME